MFIGYCRVSTKGQLDGNSIEEQTLSIRERYPTAEIVVESYICYAIQRRIKKIEGRHNPSVFLWSFSI